MISTKNMMDPLLELGLNKYEAKVYLTLVAEGTSTAKNIADIAGIPYGKVYEIINSLSKKGFSMVLPTKPMRCQAVSPKDVMVSVKEKSQQKHKKLESQITEQLEPMFKESRQFKEPKSLFWIINGRSNVTKKLNELFRKSRKSINIYISSNGLSRLLFHKEVLKEMHKKGVAINIAAVTNKKVLEEINSLNFCCIKRILEAGNHFFSVDGKECVVIEPIPDDDNLLYGRDQAIWISNPSFANFFEKFFNADFNRAKKINNN
ncbi:hypothetical protein KY317_03020 [Candidatus Woesearchaeota archaeon]|nr:hypothetical protein [Candidatus Woesearchaeota archaeon]